MDGAQFLGYQGDFSWALDTLAIGKTDDYINLWWYSSLRGHTRSYDGLPDIRSTEELLYGFREPTGTNHRLSVPNKTTEGRHFLLISLAHGAYLEVQR